MLNETLKHAKRAIVAIVGFTLLTLGIVMLVTPGPGWAVIILGLSILAIEFVWARRLLKRLKQAGSDIKNSIFNNRGAKPNGQARGEDATAAQSNQSDTHRDDLGSGS
jgi:uncharacterized protein (TIGR02611 family)